jgi:hypothetical protein
MLHSGGAKRCCLLFFAIFFAKVRANLATTWMQYYGKVDFGKVCCEKVFGILTKKPHIAILVSQKI